MKINKLIEGAMVIGAEPTDYPCTDEVTIYLKKKSGKCFALRFGTDVGHPFYIDVASLK